MMLRVVFIFVIALSINSCDFLKKNTGLNLSKFSIDTIVDYNKVDEFPVFPNCKSLIDTDKKNRCFINNLYNHFSNDLLKETFGVPECTNETVLVKILIDAKGKSSLVSIESSDLIANAIPRLNQILESSVQSVPDLFPATKQGIPVSTIFELPIVIKIK